MKFLLSPFNSFIRRIQRSRLRQMMRGYGNLRKSGQLSSISVIKNELTVGNLNVDEKFFSARFFGAGLASAELIVRQYLLLRIGGLNLNRALLLAAGKSGGKVVFSMPAQWIKVVEKNGFKVNRLASSVMWAGYVTTLYFYGLFTIGKILMNSVGAQDRKCVLKPHVYFHSLAPNNIPKQSSDGVSYDIMTWYLQWQGGQSDINAIHHTVHDAHCKCIGDIELVERSGPLPILAGKSEFASYIVWALSALVVAAFAAVRGHWWYALLLNQAALAVQARIVPADFLAREYLFHNSDWIYHPLWTYEVERKGSIVSFYFYSAVFKGFMQGNELRTNTYGWEAMNWPRYLVWDEDQVKYVRRAVGVDAKVEIVGPIWFSDSNSKIFNFPPKTLGVFDVQPMRDSLHYALAWNFDYYEPNIAIQFLLDIRAALKNSDFYMVHKRKREIRKSSHPLYRLALKRLERSTNYIAIDPDLSAASLIQKCDAVISMPFTSTALLGREAKKPSIYYDPSGLLQKDDPAAHGIMIIQGKKELGNWLANLEVRISEA